MDSTLKALHRNVAEWLAGPSGSVFLHLVIILALLFLVDLSAPPEDLATVEVVYLEPDAPPIEPPPPPIEPPSPDPEPDPSILQPPEPGPADEPPAPPPPEEFGQNPSLESTPELGFDPAISVLVIKDIPRGGLGQRMGAENRQKAGDLHGGPWAPYAEVSVRRALEWLRTNQNPDGSWSTHDREAMTGLAILTYLAHGETTASVEFGETVKRAVQYLVARQNAEGEFARIDTTAGTYAQAICVYAISEAYGMTRIPSLKPPMEKGVEVLIHGQQAGGGFDYRFEKGPRRDTSLGGWCSQAMKAAFIAGSENSRLKPAMDLAVADMKSAQKADGSFYYSNKDSHSTHGITAVAVLSMQLLGSGREKAVQNGLDFLRAAACDWKNPPNWPMYAWYYISQTKFHQGGGSWKSWNNQFAPEFIHHQNPDGSWDSAGLSLEAGTTGRENMHRVYATTMAALTLQVYYRFLPTYQPIAEKPVEAGAGDDVKIEVL